MKVSKTLTLLGLSRNRVSDCCEMFPRKNLFPRFIMNLVVISLPLKDRVNVTIRSSM